MKNTIIVNNIEFRQTTTCPRIYISKDGSYIIPEGKDPKKIRTGTKMYNKNGYPLQEAICTTVKVEINGKTVSRRVVKNVGRLVLDAWNNDIDDTLEVDHIDRNPFNNNITNLRLVTKSVNANNRTLTVQNNPIWLHTPEIAAKRAATKLAKKNGTYIEPEKTHKEKLSFEEKYNEHQKTIQENREKRKIETLRNKIAILKVKLESTSNNERSHTMYDKYLNRIQELENELNNK